MSRTKKGKKGPGYEYWSRRPGTRKGGMDPGKYSKKLNARLERIEGKEEIEKQIEDSIESDNLSEEGTPSKV